MSNEIDIAGWDQDLTESRAAEPRGVPEQYMIEALPDGVAVTWLEDARRRGLVERSGEDRWRLTSLGWDAHVPPPSCIGVGLPAARGRRRRR